jgi:hypothetical protein
VTARLWTDMPEDTYHRLDALGSSDCKNLLEAAKLFAYAREHDMSTDAMHVGTALDAIVFGTAEVDVADPDASTEAELVEAGIVAVTPGEALNVAGMTRALMAHPTARRFLGFTADGQREPRALQQPTALAVIDGVPCKGRPDVLHPGWVVADLKKLAKNGWYGIRAAIRAYGYDFQAAHYREVLQAQGRPELAGLPHVLVTVQPEPPHLVQCAVVPEAWIDRAHTRTAQAREIWRDCTAAGVWPDRQPELIDDLDRFDY